jgi:hypothetical protein
MATAQDIEQNSAIDLLAAAKPVSETIGAPAAEGGLAEVAIEVRAVIGDPIDKWAVAAALESLGFRDVDAVERFKKASVFELAEDVFAHIRTMEPEKRNKPRIVKRRRRGGGKIQRVFRHYGKGAVAALPMLGQIIAILVLRYSLWAWIDFTEAQATIVALGTLLSFMVTGGFIQSIGREGVRYVGSENYHLAEKTCWMLVQYGTITVLAVGMMIVVLNTFIPLYDAKLTIVSIIYYLLLSEIWLYASVAIVLGRPMAVLLVTTVGLVPVYLIMEYTSLGIYLAHWSGMGFALLLLMLYTMIESRRLSEKTIPELKAGRLPKPSVRTYLVAPYFVYGLFYFLNIFIDRFVSWSAPNPEPPPYLFWFRTSYELGLDWALISLVFTLALLEYVIHEFSYLQIPAQRAVKSVHVQEYVRFFKRFYKKFLLIVISVAVIDILLTYFGVLSFRQLDEVKEVREFFSSPTTFLVFYAAAVGYMFVAIGLYNSLFFFTLSRPEFVLRSIIPATAINLVVAIVASRYVHFEYGVFGLVAGGLTFALLTTGFAQRFFRNLDYYYYAAY